MNPKLCCAIIVTTSSLSSCLVLGRPDTAPNTTIRVGPAEVYDNGDISQQLNAVREQLQALRFIDQSSIVGALSNLQGAQATQSGFALSILGRQTPSVVDTSGTTQSSSNETTASNGSTVVTTVNAGSDPSTTVETTVPQSTGSKQTTGAGTTSGSTVTKPGLTPAAPASGVPPAAVLPNLGPNAGSVLDQQVQLASQAMGYELLLKGSQFARYSTNGEAKDRIIVGLPITLMPGAENEDQAAEVTAVYFPPNPDQFDDPHRFESIDLADLTTRRTCSEGEYTDPNARVACQRQERTPTIINILPAERTYNTVGISSSSATFGLGAVFGAFNVGASGGFGKQTQYLIAQQDTVGMPLGEVVCERAPAERPDNDEALPTKAIPANPKKLEAVVVEPAPGPIQNANELRLKMLDRSLNCVPGSRGIAFKWQFRPVLGERFVRTGTRKVYVQLAIPVARRPYPNYAGIIRVNSTWHPFSKTHGVVAPAVTSVTTVASSKSFEPVLGPPFISSSISDIQVRDVGKGQVSVKVEGSFLDGADVRVAGSKVPSQGDYSSLRFTANAQSLAAGGAVLISSGGVDTPLSINSLCKNWDPRGECYRHPDDIKAIRLKVLNVTTSPLDEDHSLVQVKVMGDRTITDFPYHQYLRLANANALGGALISEGTQDVVGNRATRKPASAVATPGISSEGYRRIRELPLLVRIGGQAYGLSDHPFQDLTFVKATTPRTLGVLTFTLIVDTESLDKSPQLTVHRLFGDAESDSLPVTLITPGQLQTRSALPDNEPDCGQHPLACPYHLRGPLLDMVSQPLPSDCGASAQLATVASGILQRSFTANMCATQVVLSFNTDPPQNITVPLNTPKRKTPKPGFVLTQSTGVVTQIKGVAYASVSISKLKDASATIAVANADIVRAIDGTGRLLPVLSGNKVSVTQNISATFELRNIGPGNIAITAEGTDVEGEATGSSALSFVVQ